MNSIFTGYDYYRTARKRKDSKELLYTYIKKEFKENGIDIDFIGNTPEVFKQLFWEIKRCKEIIWEMQSEVWDLEVREGAREIEAMASLSELESFITKQKKRGRK